MRRSRQTKDKLQRCSHHQSTQSQPPETLTLDAAVEVDAAEICNEQSRRFFGCYLLTSLSPRYKGHTYIGFTVNPKRRIRQHNGEIASGAFRTKRKRPWEMVFCIHGFPTQVAALQFEWAWQHPKESLAVREAASTFKTLGGLANKIKLALTMLTLQSWESMDLTVSFFSTKYMKHTAGCPSLPRQMKLHFCSMDELPCYWHSDHPYGYDDEDDIDSNHTEDFADLGGDREASSIDGIVDISRSSIDIERFTVPNASENICTWDERRLGGPLQGDSPAMVGNATVEEDEQLLQSPSTDVNTKSNTREQVQLGKEISTQELIQSSYRIDPSEKELCLHPVLEEDMEPYCQFPADVLRLVGSNMNEKIQLRKEMRTEGQRDSFPIVEELTEPLDQVDPSEGESSSRVIEKFANKDDMICILIDESTEEHRHLTYEQLPVRVRDNVWPSSMEGIEVIDLFTPSPQHRIISGSKKRRAARDHPDIIDLTRSPVFVQL